LTRYLLGRLGQSALVLVGISILSFASIHLVPGDPARAVLGPRASTQAVATLRAELGLTKPLVTQYLSYVENALSLNFGTSVTTHQAVASEIGPRLGVSGLLIGYSLLLSIVIAVPLGVIAGARRNRSLDVVIRLASTLAFAMPLFSVSLVLVLVFSLDLGWFPTSGYGTGFAQHVRALTLPAIAVALSLTPILIRTVRSSVVEALTADFVEAAYARGLSTFRVLFRHVLRNALLAPLTIAGIFAGGLIAGAVVAENIFALPGLGSLLVQSVSERDFPTVQALALVLGVAVIGLNLVTDLLYMLADPRVRI
jgi:peptide/nickel transport system permease protein